MFYERNFFFVHKKNTSVNLGSYLMKTYEQLPIDWFDKKTQQGDLILQTSTYKKDLILLWLQNMSLFFIILSSDRIEDIHKIHLGNNYEKSIAEFSMTSCHKAFLPDYM